MHLKLQEDLNLGEVVDRHWPEILDQTYLFDRRKREVSDKEFFGSIFLSVITIAD